MVFLYHVLYDMRINKKAAPFMMQLYKLRIRDFVISEGNAGLGRSWHFTSLVKVYKMKYTEAIE